jgi:hypothetical protein
MAARSWTPEQRERQRDAITRWKPWEQSTGPRTTEGKARVSQNGWKGGAREMMRDIGRALRQQKKALGDCN